MYLKVWKLNGLWKENNNLNYSDKKFKKNHKK